MNNLGEYLKYILTIILKTPKRDLTENFTTTKYYLFSPFHKVELLNLLFQNLIRIIGLEQYTAHQVGHLPGMQAVLGVLSPASNRVP